MAEPPAREKNGPIVTFAWPILLKTRNFLATDFLKYRKFGKKSNLDRYMIDTFIKTLHGSIN